MLVLGFGASTEEVEEVLDLRALWLLALLLLCVLSVRVAGRLGRRLWLSETGEKTSPSLTAGRAKDDRCHGWAREWDLESCCGSRNCMPGGTDCEVSRSTGPLFW